MAVDKGQSPANQASHGEMQTEQTTIQIRRKKSLGMSNSSMKVSRRKRTFKINFAIEEHRKNKQP
jgi:hypothetical protein